VIENDKVSKTSKNVRKCNRSLVTPSPRPLPARRNLDACGGAVRAGRRKLRDVNAPATGQESPP